MEEFKIVLAIIIGIAFMIVAIPILIESIEQIRYWNAESKISEIRAKKSKEEYKKLVNQGKIFDSFRQEDL